MHDVARAGRSGFALLGVVQATLIFTIMILSVPLPLVAGELGLGPAGLLLLNAAYGLSFSSLLLFGGRLTDRQGGRAVLRSGLLLFAASSVLCALAPSPALLLAGRFAQGLGAALIAPAAVAVVRELHPRAADYRRAMAVWGGLSVLGASVGNLLSGAVAAWVSWRWLFAVPVLVAVTALARSGALPQAAPAPARTPARTPGLDLRGAALATAGVCAVSCGLVASTGYGWRSPSAYAPVVLGALLLSAFAAAERRTADPLLPPGFLAERRRATALAAVMATATGTALSSLLIALHLQQERGWGVLATSGAFLPFALTLPVAGRTAAAVTARRGPVPVTAAGLALAGAGLGLLAGLGPGSGYATGLLPGLVLLAAGSAASFAGAAVLATAGVPPERTGLAAGLFNTAMELGPAAGVAALMALAAVRPGVDGYALAFAAAAVLLVLTAAAVAALPRSAPVETPPHPAAAPLTPTIRSTDHHEEYPS